MEGRLRSEIVSRGVPGMEPARDAGAYVDPEDGNARIGAPDVVVIDTRNDYEVDIGTFSGAINPQTASFSDFPDWFDRLSSGFGDKPPRIAMFCTGGLRCEKATAFVRSEEHTSELQSLMRNSYDVFCLQKKQNHLT